MKTYGSNDEVSFSKKNEAMYYGVKMSNYRLKKTDNASFCWNVMGK